jgi:hypothetical protein
MSSVATGQRANLTEVVACIKARGHGEHGHPTFTWVRLAQRIPVGIHLTHLPPGVLISAGMTCTVVMKEGAVPEIGAGIKKVMTAVFGAGSG